MPLWCADTPVTTVSSTLIGIPGRGNVLLDCGEGTWGQLVRLFGDDFACSTGVWEEIRKLKCIFLSHIHGDHHIGLAKVLAMRKKVCLIPSHSIITIC
jgi:ribonuclease Z